MPKKKRPRDIAQKIMESVLDDAIAARNCGGSSAPPFDVVKPNSCPPELAHSEHIPSDRTRLSYRIWLEPRDYDLDLRYAELLLSIEALPHIFYSGCKDTLEKVLLWTTTDHDGNSKSFHDMIPLDKRGTLLEEYAHDTMETYLHRIGGKIGVAIDEAVEETKLLCLVNLCAKLARIIADAGGQISYDPNNGLKFMKLQLLEAEALRRRTLMQDVADYLGLKKFSLSDLGEHYKKMLPVWKDAKIIYKQNSSRVTWRNIVRAAYPEVKFDDDLISRLSGRLNDLPQEIQAKLSDKGGDSKPSSIALEHAARLCGAQPYQYSLRHLYNIKNEMERKSKIDGEEKSN